MVLDMVHVLKSRAAHIVKYIFVCLLLLQQFTPLVSIAAEQPGSTLTNIVSSQAPSLEKGAASKEDDMRELDRQIILELVELDRFNIQYRLEINHTAGWRKVLYPLAQTGNAAALAGNTIVGLRQNVRGWNQPQLVSDTALRKGFSSAMVGTMLGGASSSVELIADGMQTLHDRKMGFSPKRALSFEKHKVNHINQLLAVRDDLMVESRLTGNRRELVELKGQMCRYIRDRLVSEFEQWYIHAREYSCYRNTFYALNVITNATRFAAVQIAFKGLNSFRYNGALGPTLIASGFIASITPALSSATGLLMRKCQTKHLAGQFRNAEALSNEDMEQHYQYLCRLLASTGELDERNKKLLSELAILRKDTLGIDETVHRESDKIKELRRVAAQHAIVGPIVGSLSLTSGIMNTIAYHGYRQQPKISNRLLLSGGLSTLNGEVLALYITPKSAISGFLYEHDLRRRGQHPDQLLAKRLSDLDDLEATIKSNSQ